MKDEIALSVIKAEIIILTAELEARSDYYLNKDFQLECEVIRKKIKALKLLTK